MTMIRVGAAPERLKATGLFFDGDIAVGIEAAVQIDDDAGVLTISAGDQPQLRWPLDAIRLVPDQAGGDLIVLRLRDDPVARLILRDQLILEQLPNARRTPPTAKRGRILGWATAAVASVALIILVLVPVMANQLANYLPPAGERALGEATLNQIRTALDETGLGVPIRMCRSADGQEALDDMLSRLTGEIAEPPEVRVLVLDHGMRNAFALPGGYVVFFRGLIHAAESPEEVAAVLAHEIGHVVSRDPTRHALRSAGSIGVLGLLFGDFAGGALVLFLAEALINATYSREAEAEADDFARKAMIASDIDPASLGSYFARMLAATQDGAPEFFRHFASHPKLSDRILAAQQPLHENFAARPVLSEKQWAALRGVCGDDE